MNKGLGKKSLLLIIVLLLALGSTGIAYALSVHTLPPTKLSAWQGWVVVTQAQFEAGVINQTDTSSSPGDVKLAVNYTGPNVASQASGGVASASSEHSSYPATNANDGNYATEWGSKGKDPQWLQINFTSNQTINKMVLYWKAGSYYGIDFKLQIWNGTAWVTVDDVTGNSAFSYTSTFDAVTTDKIRYYETQGSHSTKAFLAEFEAYTAYYYSSGSIASKVYDTGKAGASWDGLGWNETLPSGTSITFEVRASDTAFAKTDTTPTWQPASALPITGRYQQWRATLTTSDSSKTPVLSEVRVLYH